MEKRKSSKKKQPVERKKISSNSDKRQEKMKNHSHNRRRMQSSRSRKSFKWLSVLWNLFFYLVMLTILIGAGLMAVMQQQDKSLNGFRMFGVLTDSMVSKDNTIKPGGFRSGSILITKEVDPKSIKVGDVITYRPSTNPVNASTNFLTHRVVKVSNELGDEKGIFYTTRGDANDTDDMPISSSALVGKEVFVIPILAGILFFVKENWLVSLIFLGSLLGFIWVVRMYIMSNNEDVSRRPQKKKAKKRNLKSNNHNDITLKKDNINKKLKIGGKNNEKQKK